MKIAIIGAGALGSLFGGLLAQSGQEVWLFNPHFKEHIEKIKTDGLWIEQNGTSKCIKVKATCDIAEIEEAELVGIFVKAYDTEAAVRAALPIIRAKTVVLSVQNGLGNLDIMARYVEKERLLGGITAQGATLLGPGRIKWAGRGPTRLGAFQPSPKTDAIANRIIEMFNQAGIETAWEADIKRAVWEKLLINSGINALTALFGVKNGVLVSDASLNEIMRAVLREAVTVAQKRGFDFAFDEIIRRTEEVCHKTAENLSSMLQDVRRGKQTEIDYINGAIVKEAERLGIPTPLNRLLTLLVKQGTAKRGVQ